MMAVHGMFYDVIPALYHGRYPPIKCQLHINLVSLGVISDLDGIFSLSVFNGSQDVEPLHHSTSISHPILL